jgi:uncharacterized protein (TIGR02145 family)
MKETKVGTQIWTKENLSLTKFLNGDDIPLVTNSDEWSALGKSKKPACAYLSYDEKNGKKFGLLYNYYAIIDKRGLAPEGWSIPACKDWEQLIKELGGENKAGIALKKKKAWNEDECSDKSGFSVIPSCHHDEYGNDNTIMMTACFWTSTKEGKNDADYVMIGSYSGEATIRVRGRAAGFSVRCVKNI